MVQVPLAMNVAVVPEIVQMPVVVEVKLTAKPDVAVAESVSGVPTVCVAIAGKLIVCGLPLTWTLCGTIVAAA
jgi:hypothetical protein